MIQLNLLPQRYRAAELLRKTLMAATVAYLLAAGWLAWSWSVDRARLEVERRDVARVQAQLDSPKLQVAVQAVKKFADDMAAVKVQASVVDTLRRQQVPLLRVADAAPDWCMGGRAWLVNLDAAAAGESSKVTLSGVLDTDADFPGYYDFMGSQPGVGNLSLPTAPSDSLFENEKVVHFTLGFTMAGLP